MENGKVAIYGCSWVFMHMEARSPKKNMPGDSAAYVQKIIHSSKASLG